MINYYLRPDGAHIKIDSENKIAINVLNTDNHKFIGHITNPVYVDNMIGMINKFTPATEEAFLQQLNEVKQHLASL